MLLASNIFTVYYNETMRPQSAKSKGRRLQQKIVADLYETFAQLGDGDIRSTSMGAGGEDILLSAAARKLIPFSFEAKNQERVNIWEAYTQCKANCGEHAPAVVIKKNHSDMLCLIQWSTFLDLLKSANMSVEQPTMETVVDVQNISEMSIPEQLRKMADMIENS
tara:strand:- start:89 stop:583 length:495 start_codon:yes stop_codon:yes gene_type:complete